MLVKAKHTVSAYQRETVPFLGLNRSDDTREGEFSGQKNMSDRRYPFLAPRLPRAAEKFDAEPSALFSWDGAQIMVRDGKLLYNGESLCNVMDGPKQFAVVNTKLVVWPDRITVDLTNKTVKEMFVSATNSATATFTTNSIAFEWKKVYAAGSANYASSDATCPWVWTYSDVKWTEEGGWELTDPQLVSLSSGAHGRIYIPAVAWNDSTQKYVYDKPQTSGWSSKKPTNYPEPEPGNDLGFYAVLESNPDKDSYTGIDGSRWYWLTTCYWEQENNLALAEVFSAGDAVTVSGSLYGLMDVERSVLESVDSENNTLKFKANVFPTCEAVYKRQETQEAYEVQAFQYTDEAGDPVRLYWNATTTVQPGQLIAYHKEENAVRFYESEAALKEGTAFHSVTPKTATSLTSYNKVIGTLLSATDRAITVTREGPALDYICEHENRLWGVSNADKTIYASALGDPNNFYDYTGEAGGYAVAVGSEGDFTGICSYGNAVLCWKERTLHKVLGDYPSNYQTATYRFSGVRAGAHKSLVNVNETLFFLGVDGVYAYSGNKPSLISRTLGTDVLKNGVGGTDGKVYYLSVENGEEWELLSYDTHTGLWFRSDETQVVDFCRVGDDVKFLSGDTVYTIGGGDEQVEWETVFVPMYETLEGGKQYNRLIFRVEVPKDGWLAADVRFDGGRWMQVGLVKDKSGPVHMPVPLRRCDKFQVRLRGKGDCAVLEMAREFRLRGDG